jgi:hypothetical protein
VVQELTGETFQELVIEPVFGLFNAEERTWGGIFEKQQVGEHLQRPVGHALLVERVCVSPFVELQEKATIGSLARADLLDTRDSFRDAGQNPTESFRVGTLEILDDVSQILTRAVEMSLRTRGR